jgi:hypothetical protein
MDKAAKPATSAPRAAFREDMAKLPFIEVADADGADLPLLEQIAQDGGRRLVAGNRVWAETSRA